MCVCVLSLETGMCEESYIRVYFQLLVRIFVNLNSIIIRSLKYNSGIDAVEN
jgi:hypothetical protein